MSLLWSLDDPTRNNNNKNSLNWLGREIPKLISRDTPISMPMNPEMVTRIHYATTQPSALNDWQDPSHPSSTSFFWLSRAETLPKIHLRKTHDPEQAHQMTEWLPIVFHTQHCTLAMSVWMVDNTYHPVKSIRKNTAKEGQRQRDLETIPAHLRGMLFITPRNRKNVARFFVVVVFNLLLCNTLHGQLRSQASTNSSSSSKISQFTAPPPAPQASQSVRW